MFPACRDPSLGGFCRPSFFVFFGERAWAVGDPARAVGSDSTIPGAERRARRDDADAAEVGAYPCNVPPARDFVEFMKPEVHEMLIRGLLSPE